MSEKRWNWPEPKAAGPYGTHQVVGRLSSAESEAADAQSFVRPPILTEAPTAVLRDYLLHVDSGSRNLQLYPGRASFRYDLEEPIKNVVCAELLTIVVPNIADLIAEPYILLDLGELNTFRGGVNQTPCFTVLYTAPRVHPTIPLVAPVPDTDVIDGLIPYDKKLAERIPATYFPTKGQINSITVTLRDRNGNVLNIGSDPTTVLQKCQWSFGIKLTAAVTPPQTSSRFGG